ncbi:UNVERIFIED_CONTAM: Transcription factor GATA-5 [Siphonaria sp. JEL0065]|nr:Transcription factor GATA-5 [Siphonaria sp. JEL0065]
MAESTETLLTHSPVYIQTAITLFITSTILHPTKHMLDCHFLKTVVTCILSSNKQLHILIKIPRVLTRTFVNITDRQSQAQFHATIADAEISALTEDGKHAHIVVSLSFSTVICTLGLDDGSHHVHISMINLNIYSQLGTHVVEQPSASIPSSSGGSFASPLSPPIIVASQTAGHTPLSPQPPPAVSGPRTESTSSTRTVSTFAETPKQLQQKSPQPPLATQQASQHECTNCHSNSTSHWRKTADGRLLCNACGLFEKKNGAKRQELSPKDSGSTSTSKPRKEKKDGNIWGPDVICSNCLTTSTSLWRRGDDGQPICNACGLYKRLHGMDRPRELVKEIIRRRRRVPKARAPAANYPVGTTSDPIVREHVEDAFNHVAATIIFDESANQIITPPVSEEESKEKTESNEALALLVEVSSRL